MRTRLPAFLLALACAVPAHGASRNFEIAGFEKIRVEGPFKVKLTTGVAPSASASGSPGAIDKVAIEMRGNTLVVHANASSWGGYPGQASGPVEIALGTHDLRSAWISGSGALAIDKVRGLSFDLSVQGSGAASVAGADVDQLSIAVVGTANATVAGKARMFTAVVRGISNLDATNLAAKDATIGAEGSATVAAKVSNSVKVDGNGPVTIRFTGDPACTLRVGGSATVSGCKSTSE